MGSRRGGVLSVHVALALVDYPLPESEQLNHILAHSHQPLAQKQGSRDARADETHDHEQPTKEDIRVQVAGLDLATFSDVVGRVDDAHERCKKHEEDLILRNRGDEVVVLLYERFEVRVDEAARHRDENAKENLWSG